MLWPLPPGPSWSIWSSSSSSRSAISRRGWSAWTRSCGTRSATSSAAGCSTATGANSSIPTAATRAPATPPREIAAGRGSPHGGVYLSFTHVPRAALDAAFGPVVERLARHGIDLTRAPVEVAPIAHYHMGGIAVDAGLATRVPGLFAAGEAAGGANGANRLSGNAIPEALVFGETAGRAAAAYAARRGPARWRPDTGRDAAARLAALRRGRNGEIAAAALLDDLRTVMQDLVGPFRDAAGLARALARIREMRAGLDRVAVAPGAAFNQSLADWLELRLGLLAAEAVAAAALARRESRGAHQRDDFPATDPAWARRQRLAMDADGAISVT